MKLKFRFFILIICTILIPIITVVAITYQSINNSITTIEIDKGEKNIAHTSEYLDSLLESQKASMNSWLPWQDLYNAVKDKDVTWMNDNVGSSAKEDTPNEVLMVLDNNFNTLFSSGDTPKAWQKANVKDLKIIKEFSSSNYFISDFTLADNSTYILSLGKICDNDDTKYEHPIGYFLTARKLTSAMMNKGKKIVDADITLKFENGYTVSTLKKPEIVNPTGLGANEIKSSKTLFKDNMVVQAESLYKDVSGTPIGVLHVETTSTSGVKALNVLTKYSILLIVTILLLSIIIQFWLSFKVTKPINKIVNIIKQKDLSQLVETKGTDEISLLGQEFNCFMNNLMENFKYLKKAINELKIMGSHFIEIYAESGKSMEQISTSIENSTVFLNSNVNELKNITKAVNETNNNGEQILTILELLRTDSENINLSANKGLTSLNSLSLGIKATEDKFNSSFAAVDEFTKSAKSIYDFTDLISEISSQSNLLALNASIEAARAGEAGRGFAIVSNEIGKLAIQTENAVKQLSSIINNILESTAQSNSSIEDVKKQLISTQQISSSTHEEISTILTSIISITKLISNIASQSEDQEKLLNDIMKNIELIDSSFEKVNNNFEEVTETSQSHLINYDGITRKADEMSSTIKDLDSIINQFKGI